jgi:hypothetical protein
METTSSLDASRRLLVLSQGALIRSMAANPTAKKRQREKDRQEHQRDKAALRIQRRQERAQRPASEPGVDPDIADIVPGPQPIVDEDLI